MKKSDIPKGYKPTAVGVIPEDWEVKTLGQAFDFISGYAFSSNQFNSNGLKLITPKNFTKNGSASFEKNNTKYTAEEVDRKYYCKEGDLLILLTDLTPTCELLGKPALLTKKDGTVLLNQRIVKLNPKRNLNPRFVNNFLLTDSPHKWIKRTATGSTVKHSSNNSLSNIKIPLPPLPEQQKIAAILSNWDLALEQCEAAISTLKKRNKGLAQQLLSGQKRLDGFEGEWQEYQFGDLIKEVKRPIEWDDEELYQLISVRRRSGGLFKRDSLYGKEIKTKNLRTAKKDDFLISKMQIVHGAAGLVTEEFDDMKISGSYIAVRSKTDKILDIRYLNWLSKLPRFYHQTYTSSFGVHIEKMTFSFKLFLKEKIHLPKHEEQQAIVNILQQADRELELQIAKRDALQEQKKGLMQKLLTGEVRVSLK